MVKRFFLSFLFSCGLVCAQSTLGYFFVAPGGITAGGATQGTYGVGGGVERLLGRGIGAGVELEGVVPAVGRASNSVGIFSLNASYHFLKERKLDPFATAGYSLLFRTSTANLFNYGGGLNYWFHDNVGLQLAIRDRVWSRGGVPAAHYWGVRVGLSFR